MMSEKQIAAFLVAHAEGRVGWIVTGPRGEPCNGGSGPRLPMPTDNDCGAWQPAIDNARICERGYHMTDTPHRWRGVRVFLGEGRGAAGRQDDKSCWRERRAIAEVMPEECINRAVYCAVRRADLRGADLRGADLRGAYLRGAYLRGADLRGADLRGAYLRGADLRGADLRGAYLQGAYLRGADLRGADLRGAYLRGAYLQGAYLQGGSLIGPDGQNYTNACDLEKFGARVK